jgi:hypothetical protein
LDEGGVFMDELMKYLTKKVPQTIMVVFGLIVPGMLSILIFREDLIISLDIFKLIVLSISICCPSYFACILACLFLVDKDEEYALLKIFVFGTVMNTTFFIIGLFNALFIENSVKTFIKIIFILSIGLIFVGVCSDCGKKVGRWIVSKSKKMKH